MIGVLVGNKTDLRTSDAVNSKEAQAFAKECGLQYFETSAAQGQGINEPFQFMAEQFSHRYEEAVEQFDQMR